MLLLLLQKTSCSSNELAVFSLNSSSCVGCSQLVSTQQARGLVVLLKGVLLLLLLLARLCFCS